MSLDRRRYARHKIHTPAYASVAGSSGGVIADANDRGILLQTVNPLPLFSFIDIRLDLLETRGTLATSARVVWSDAGGRAGIEFINLTAEANRQLKQWLLVNALAAIDAGRAGGLGASRRSTDHSPVPESTPPLISDDRAYRVERRADPQRSIPRLSRSEERISAAQKNVTQRVPEDTDNGASGIAQITDPSVNTAMPLGGPDIENELRSVVQHAQAVTGADGAAIALAQAEAVVCRASAGEIAPPLGSRLNTDSGISGACLRSARTLHCQDAELDLYVDRESCRALGISSVLAVPIIAENISKDPAASSLGRQSEARSRVVGLVEVFSRRAYAFDRNHCTALEGLARSIAKLLESEPLRSKDEADVPASAALISQPQGTSGASKATPTSAVETDPTEPARTSPLAQPPTKLAPTLGMNDINVREPDEAAGRKLSAEASKRILFLALLGGLIVAGLFFSFVNPLNRSKASAGSSATEEPQSTGRSGDSDTPATGESLQELRKKAEQGIAAAQFALGAKYANGEDLAQNYTAAVKWFSKAAEQGHVLAAATLGAYYWAGRGVAPDYVSAYMWSAIAKAEGDEASKYRVAILSSRMSSTEIAEGQSRAAAWLREHPKQISQNDRNPSAP